MLFLLSLRCQPISTLFPYTTLFRSLLEVFDMLRGHLGPEGDGHVSVGCLDDGVFSGGGSAHEDRKSTRLNSSHVSISYAVFCLKKKTTVRQALRTRSCLSSSMPPTS